MISLKRLVCAVICLCILIAAAGCGKIPAVDPDLKMEDYFSQYTRFTELYGTPRMDTPAALGVDLQQIENISENRWGMPIQEEYGGFTFDVSTMFRGAEYCFSGVMMTKTYAYPEETDEIAMDTAKLCKQLVTDFGDASDTSFFFNWVDVMLGEEWNREIKFWQDPFVLLRVIEAEYGGSLLVWDLSPVASQTVKNHTKSLGFRHTLTCSLHIYATEGRAELTIAY